ncbi:hypothetical protein IEQ44_07900 [Nocardioides sp. Y6]|uniref:Uncharacterized protein n=1 Tax=Nocardioides malaquae TaxID=2773426 RepID=A0ABR9RTT3_9ACTN|nr:hypothetical protein [Nocardioides malaquae]MBE7324572.1 hypothetical protein [Nocardioides malaquae]
MAAYLPSSSLHRIQGVAGLLLLLTLPLPWLRRTAGDAEAWVPGWWLASGDAEVGDSPIPTFLAVLVLALVLAVAVTAALSWWRRSVGAAVSAGGLSLAAVFVMVGAASPRELAASGVDQSVAPGLMLAVFLCGTVLVSCLALLATVTPDDA